MARPQRTIAESTELAGVGLFSGQEVTVRLRPADAFTGYLFVRTDLPDSPVVPAKIEAVGNGYRCTTLNWNNVEVKAVEHLLSACVGLGVDNLMIEVDADELPALGGSPLEYGRALQEAGVSEQNAERRVLRLEETVSVPQGRATIVAMPQEEGFTVSYVLDFDEGYHPTEAFTVSLEPESYMQELAPARTFGLGEDYEEFRRLSLGGGITDENAFVLCRDGSVKKPRSGEPAELHFPDEAVRHKVVDLLGDLALVNADLQMRIVAVRSGHRLNTSLAQQFHRLMAEETGREEYLDVLEIRRILPHRYPFLMVDRVLRVEGENKLVAVKNCSINEPYFQGHYPEYPILPGVLQLEALAQSAGLLLLRKLEHTGRVCMLVGVNGAKLRRPVNPGDQLTLEVEAVRVRSRTALVKGRGTVDGELACEAEMSFMLVDADAL
ncbi:MAG: UDP-3-O-acyl-N-acetylglucosamine deacetylase [Candidatus Brocadiaceae bacterium]|jgi:UDP-3-O-[3-hydroxymyristoyl] N-acetylglucosamine deacetylase/3-hydroxyacyl-[acyl-carrier-protein] dehydratase